jgi:hypothetical protein
MAPTTAPISLRAAPIASTTAPGGKRATPTRQTKAAPKTTGQAATRAKSLLGYLLKP